jgi:transcription initiation factor IIE alpha subunit
MGYYDVVELLKRNAGKKFSASEIQQVLGVNITSVHRALRRLRADKPQGFSVGVSSVKTRSNAYDYHVYWWK